jgi:hypothetical protein
VYIVLKLGVNWTKEEASLELVTDILLQTTCFDTHVEQLIENSFNE